MIFVNVGTAFFRISSRCFPDQCRTSTGPLRFRQAGKALYEPVADRIVENSEDNWRFDFGFQQRAHRLRTNGDDHTKITLCKVGRQLSQPIWTAFTPQIIWFLMFWPSTKPSRQTSLELFDLAGVCGRRT